MIEFFSFFGFGLIVGSFLNAVLWRMKEAITLGGRSMCPLCRATIAWYDNIPILSFALLGGKCRSCGGMISWRYPLVELLTSFLFVLVGETFFLASDIESWALTAFYLIATSLLILIFLFDIETMEIPNILLWIGVGSSLPILFFLDTIRFNPGISIGSLSLHSGVLAGFVGFLPLFLIASISRERLMGLGDGFLAFFLGLVVGWPNILWALLFAFGTGAFTGVLLIAIKKKNMQSQVPLGPFLIFGAFLSLFLPEWFHGLFRIFSLY